MIIERTRLGYWPEPPMSNEDRMELWRRKYRLVPIEATLPTGGDFMKSDKDLTQERNNDHI